MVTCKDQAEIDYYWGKLSAVPESEQCGWLKDKYGLSWQITSTPIQTLLKVSAVPPTGVTSIPKIFLVPLFCKRFL
jgi:predicted 3-demethylubiquinone-9 3-methyltransferase (glyoxalase superfamily)